MHGDGFLVLVLADQEGQEYMQQVLKEKVRIQMRWRKSEKVPEKNIWTDPKIGIVSYEQETGRVTYEADPRHAEMIIRQLNLQTAKECYYTKKEKF